jgi:hypothetical protein
MAAAVSVVSFVGPSAPRADARTPPPPLLIEVEVSPESRVKAARAGGQQAPLLERGVWTPFEVRVKNDARVTARLRIDSPNAPTGPGGGGGGRDRWLDVKWEDDAPLRGAPQESRILRLRSRAAGPREARLSFDVGQGTQDMGFRSDVSILFRCREARTR